MPKNPVLSEDRALELKVFHAPKHPGSICVANYKGGVGKTTVACLLGYYLAEMQYKVLLIDIDPQCSLSLAVGFDPEEVSKTELTIYNLVKPSKWTKLKKTKLENYIVEVPDEFCPEDLFIIRGAFQTEDLDFDIIMSMVQEGERRKDELFLYCKQMLNAYEDYDYIIIDCPPNKLFLTQAMLRASSFYLPVTIPDTISRFGMPRLVKWVKGGIPKGDRPKLLGYILNALNRHGGTPGGMTYSQQSAQHWLLTAIRIEMDNIEKVLIGSNPQIGVIPRLDAIARFLNREEKIDFRIEFSRKTSGQPTINECLSKITKEVLKRIRGYRAKT